MSCDTCFSSTSILLSLICFLQKGTTFPCFFSPLFVVFYVFTDAYCLNFLHLKHFIADILFFFWFIAANNQRVPRLTHQPWYRARLLCPIESWIWHSLLAALRPCTSRRRYSLNSRLQLYLLMLKKIIAWARSDKTSLICSSFAKVVARKASSLIIIILYPNAHAMQSSRPFSFSMAWSPLPNGTR